MKIRNKISLTYIAVFVVIMAAIGVSMAYFGNSSIESEVLDHLENAAESRANHIETYLDQNIDRLKLVTSRTKLRRLLDEYISDPAAYQGNISDMQGILRDASEPVGEIERICIVSPEGEVVVSTADEFVGVDCRGKDFYEEGLDGYGSFIVDEEDRLKLFVAGPINRDGKLLGVGLTVVGLDTLKIIVEDRTGMGDSGEILVAIAGEDGPLFISERKFVGDVMSDPGSHDEFAGPMRQALQGNEDVYFDHIDYRGEEVTAVTRYIDGAKIGLVAKVDNAELYESNRDIVLSLLLIVGLAILLYIIIGYFVAKKITDPIYELRKGVAVVEGGNLNHRLQTSRNDELGELANAFDKMTASIKASRSEVDIKVKEQTVDIERRQGEMADQQKAILNILEDVEDEKDKTEAVAQKLQSVRDRLTLATQAGGIGIWDWDVAKNHLVWDEKMYELYGVDPDDFSSAYEAWEKTVHPDDLPESNKEVQAALAGEKEFNITFRVVTEDGETRFLKGQAHVERGPRGEALRMIGVNYDVTHEMEIDQAKTEFVSLASHQLRTPLSSINWYAEMLLAGDAGELNDNQKQYLQEIYNGNQRMVELVNALLNVSRLELGTFIVEPEPTVIQKIADEVLGELKQQVAQKNLRLTKLYDDALGSINVDPKLVRVIVQNLVSNAVKYTPENGKVTVKIAKLKESALIQVTDTGLGIPKKQQKNIFTKLFRADNVKQSDTVGTGLGLYIVKAILDAAGGDVSFQSEEGRGTTFSVKIPLSGWSNKEGSRELS